MLVDRRAATAVAAGAVVAALWYLQSRRIRVNWQRVLRKRKHTFDQVRLCTRPPSFTPPFGTVTALATTATALAAATLATATATATALTSATLTPRHYRHRPDHSGG